jgi:hypothetical protein
MERKNITTPELIENICRVTKPDPRGKTEFRIVGHGLRHRGFLASEHDRLIEDAAVEPLRFSPGIFTSRAA